MKMPKKKNSDVARRAWNILRLALLWARKEKGGVFKRRLMTDLRLFPKFLKSLGHVTTDATRRDGICYRYGNIYGERQMSFDKTPVFPAVKFNGGSSSMRFLNIPCLNTPVVDFDYEFDLNENDVVYDYDISRKSFVSDKDDINEDDIDSRAEEFIAKFYEQIKMQRQISYLH